MSAVGQAVEDPSKIHAGLQLLCEDEYRGVGPILTTLLNGTRSTPEALKAINESLRSMINIARSETAKNAFRIDKTPVPPSLIDKPRQRLELLILTNLVPLLAVSSLSSIHRDLVINALQVTRRALSLSEDESAFVAAPSTLHRTRAFNRAILGILKGIWTGTLWGGHHGLMRYMQCIDIFALSTDICIFLRPKDLYFPCDCPVKMSTFKGLLSQENDPIWMSLRFSNLDDAVTVICFLVSFICPDTSESGWPGYKVDEDLRLGLLTLIYSLLEAFLPNGTFARRDRSGGRSVTVSSASITQLYQACCHCVLKTVPLLSADSRLFPPLAKSLMEILHHHIMTVEDRCKEWSTSKSLSSRIKTESDPTNSKDSGGLIVNIKECRRELLAMAVLEDLLSKSITVVMQSAFECFHDTVHMREVRLLAVNLLFSKQLLLLSGDDSGRNVQRVLILLVHRMIPSGALGDPLRAISDILDRFTHLELDLLTHLIQTALEYWSELDEHNDARVDQKPHSTLHRRLGQGNTSNKRSIEESEDYSTIGNLDMKGKRARRDSLGFNSCSPSIDSVNCSSIVSYSQLSQRPLKSASLPQDGVAKFSPSAYLLSMIKKLVNNSTYSLAASQVSRGIPPPLSIEALQSSVILIQVWTKFTLSDNTAETKSSIIQLTSLIESIGKNYIIWALSPGMQNATLNQSYLETSYPLMLDLISPLSQYELSDDLKVMLICLSSGPWFADLSKPELWRDADNSMDIDEIGGEYQLVSGIRGITEGTENLMRLKDNAAILQSCKCFRLQKRKALKIMSTLPYCPQFEVWRKDVILRTLKDSEDTEVLGDNPQRLKIAALEALTCLDINNNNDWSLDSCLNIDDEAEETKRTLAFCMGIVACSYSNIKRNKGPKYFYDALSQTFISRWACDICSKNTNVHPCSTDEVSEDSSIPLDSKLMNSFKRLIPTCINDGSRLGLLQGLYRVFCHVDLEDEDLKAMDFGKLMLSNLCDENDSIRWAAGDIAEVLSKKAGKTLANDPLAQSKFDESLSRINEAIARGLSGSQKNTAIAWPLQLCRRIMRHLPEDHPIYHSLLIKMIDQAFADNNIVRSGFVFDQLSMIATDRGLSNYRLIRPQMEYICARVIEKLEAEQDRWLEALLYPWIRLSPTRFLQQNLSELVPKMILLNNRTLIEKVAVILNEKAGGLCIRQIDHILAAIFIQLGREHFNPCIELLRSLIVQIDHESGKPARSLDIVELTTLSTEGLLCCLCVELGHEDPSKRDKAKKTIEIVENFAWERFKQEQEVQGKTPENPSLAVFLRRHVLAIMSEVNNAIMDRTQIVTLRLKAKYLRSLILLVTLLNPIQSSVLSQLVKVEQLDVMIPHIVQVMTKLYSLSDYKEKMVELEILEYFIILQQEKLRSVLPDIGILPALAEFAEMNNVIKTAKSKANFEQQLQRLIERSGNENADLAEQALFELREFLLVNDQSILALSVSKEQQLNLIMRDLIRALLSGIGRFRGLDAPVPRRCVECLGVIGAIDPAKLSSMRLVPSPPTHTNFADFDEAKNFVCEMIEIQLVGKTRSIGDIRSESHWAYTLQTLLSFCGITKGVLDAESMTPSRSFSRPIAKSAGDRWRAFPRHVQEVLELLIDAKYTKAESTAQHTYPSPLYPHFENFKDWITIWTLVLISKVNSRNAKEIFQACKHVVPYDTNICLYMLPHLVLNVLIEGTERDRGEIVNEMAAVLGKSGNWEQIGAEPSSETSPQSSGELSQLGPQTVFGVFDHISKWIQSRKNVNTKSTSLRSYTAITAPDISQTSLRQNDAALNAVQEQLTSISHEAIAMAAFRCKAYARSLLHYEQHIRDSRQHLEYSDADIQSMYEKLQEIYANLEEPDGMEGISSLITSGTVTQNLLQCESSGQWSEAQFYYEQGLQDDPGQFEYHAGLYKCLENLGHYKMMLSCVQGDIQSYPNWEQQLTDWRVGSAWKVQNWETLETALSRSVHASFETGLGQLLLDMRDNRTSEFESHLQQVRCMLIPNLAAASMESYSRAYEHVVQLHMLHELEVAFRSWNLGTLAEPDDLTGSCFGSQITRSLPDGDTYVERIRLFQNTLDQRSELLAPSFRLREQITTLRRIAFYDIRKASLESRDDASYLAESCGKLWLQSAKAARKSGNDEVSYSAMLRAEKLMNRSAPLERAKYEFLHNNERQAIKTIDMALNQSLAVSQLGSTMASRLVTSSSTSSRLRNTPSGNHRVSIINMDLKRVQNHTVDTNKAGYIRSKAYLLRTRWMDRSNLVSPNDILEGYRQATVECERWEKGYYIVGQYYLKLYDNSRRTRTRIPTLPHLTNACRLFGKALTLGPKYLYQALPRLLTFWLELGNQALLGRSSSNSSIQSNAAIEFQHVNKLMENLAGFLPEYMFLSAFPQIISRMCHKNPDAFAVLQHIIVNVVLAFPDQAIWQMVSVSRSIVQERKRVCNQILDSIHHRQLIGHAIIDQIKEALDLCDNLITLCMSAVPEKVEKLSLQKHFPKVFSQLRQNYKITVPCQRTLWPTIPESSATMATHQPFEDNLPKINSFLDEVDVMASLQKPRKITIIGSDGLHYTFLCKPKDDLRKDAKVMEFNTLVNMLLRRNREANRKNLYIRTYAVVPLNEECGLIEWVHGTIPFRHIMQKQYKMNNISLISIAEIKRILDNEDHVRMFTRDLLPKFPTVFYQWFMDISQEPAAWFETRLRYTRTTAVMSMVGYIVGNGDIVHVDFNCLFEQGKTFPKPERVPFRLTQNMVDAMGLSGYDGVYRLMCEQTLGIFRDNTESLVSVLDGFLHDPLVEWAKNKRRGQQVQLEPPSTAMPAAPGVGAFDPLIDQGVGGAVAADDTRARLRSRAEAKAKADAALAEAADTQQNEKAQTIMNLIKRKLNGSESPNGYVLSVQGQVEELIQAATCAENLSKMYIGWSAYL
ncbi:serine/threonine-protein kinase M1 [Entomortierella beljakovae]|nr:serine/threonine-protein kinase M1 [Entomortierella beljakovae]